VDGQERLAIAAEIERTFLAQQSHEELMASIKQAVSVHHQLRPYVVALVHTAGIPKTSSGKIMRQRCRAQLLRNGLPILNGEEVMPMLTRVDGYIGHY
jgi:acyl-CoA synthetase (AMP-forming)/AMP-acid ligase II